MHRVVKSFRKTFVEGRFAILIFSLLVIGMRVALYLKRGLPVIVVETDNFLWNLIDHLFENPDISLFASTVSVIIISWLLFIINNRYSITRYRTNLPFIAPLFMLSLHPYSLVMSGNYIAIILILIAFMPLLDSYQKPNAYLYSFRSSILIGVASLFQIYALVIIPLWWIGERLMRGPQIRSLLGSLFGVFLVYISVFSYYIVSDDMSGFLQPFKYFTYFSIPDIPNYTIFEWIGFLFVALLFIVNIVLSIREYTRDKVVTVNLIRFMIFLIILLLFLQVVYWNETLFYLLLSVTLISFLSSYIYSKTISKSSVYLFYTMMFLMILFHFSQYFPETFLVS